jgi:hypothetical protein
MPLRRMIMQSLVAATQFGYLQVPPDHDAEETTWWTHCTLMRVPYALVISDGRLADVSVDLWTTDTDWEHRSRAAFLQLVKRYTPESYMFGGVYVLMKGVSARRAKALVTDLLNLAKHMVKPHGRSAA